MVQAEAAVESGFRLLLKSEDQALRDLSDLDRAELESLRSVIESTLARMTDAERATIGVSRDTGFSCEWWPPG